MHGLLDSKVLNVLAFVSVALLAFSVANAALATNPETAPSNPSNPSNSPSNPNVATSNPPKTGATEAQAERAVAASSSLPSTGGVPVAGLVLALGALLLGGGCIGFGLMRK